MNIAYYSHYFTPEIGAPSARIEDLSKQWINLGHSVQVITCLPNHPTGTLYPGYSKTKYLCETLNGVRVHRHWTYITPNTGFFRKTLGHASYWPSAHFFSNRRIQRPDVVIGTSPTFFAAMAACSAGKKFGVPFVMEVRDLWPAIFVELGIIRDPIIIRLLQKWELLLYKQATRIVTVTETFRENLIQRGVPESKVHAIPNGADTDFWRPDIGANEARRDLNLGNKFVVLYIGAHGISHALVRVLEAADRLRDFKDIEFILVGEGAEKKQLLAFAEEKRLNNVKFFPPVKKDDVRRFYAAADVCLVPLRNIPLFDAFIPSKMFEMLAMARPIIASVRGESAQILERSGGAIVVQPENSEDIAAAVTRLYENRSEGCVMGQNGRSFVERFFSRRSLAMSYSKVLSESIDSYSDFRR